MIWPSSWLYFWCDLSEMDGSIVWKSQQMKMGLKHARTIQHAMSSRKLSLNISDKLWMMSFLCDLNWFVLAYFRCLNRRRFVIYLTCSWWEFLSKFVVDLRWQVSCMFRMYGKSRLGFLSDKYRHKESCGISIMARMII